MRIVANAFGQTRSQWIGYDVARDVAQVFIVAQCMVMKSALPNPLPEGQRDLGLVQADYLGQVPIFLKLKQAMDMIVHDDKSQSLCLARDIAVMETPHRVPL
jgi:hypothetical protein